MTNKKQYKIIPIQHLLKGNKIAKSGEVVAGTQFISLQDSLARGFCEEVKASKASKAGKAAAAKGEDEEVNLEELSIPALLVFAKENGFVIDEKLAKSKAKDTKAKIIQTIVDQT